MNKLLPIVCGVLFLSFSATIEAQTPLKVPFGSAKLAWDAGVPDATHSAATKHVVTCGTVSVDVLMPTTSIPVKDVVPGPGTYDCTLYAENDFTRQTEPPRPFPQFQAGYGPNTGANLRLEVQ